MTKIKICGLTRPEDIEAVNQYKPDYIGFVFAKNSRRFINAKQAADLKKQLLDDIMAVGVFVNEAKEVIADLLIHDIIDAAQLHGNETESEIRWIKTRTGKQVIKAVSVQSRSDPVRWSGSQADYLLFDHGAGGTGKAFDWNLITDCGKPFFLAGGINIQNLSMALSKGAYGIDLSGGVETDGKKDPKKIAAVIEAVRR